MLLVRTILLLTGLLMVASPVSCTKKADRTNPQAIKRVRTLGGWLTAAAVIWMITAMIAQEI